MNQIAETKAAKAVHACSACHDALDRRNNAGAPEWEHDDLLRALGETQLRLFRAGLIKI